MLKKSERACNHKTYTRTYARAYMLEKRQKIRVDREKVDPPSQKNNDFLDNIFIVDLYITQKLRISRHDFCLLDMKIYLLDMK